jgi:hypothetical protein
VGEAVSREVRLLRKGLGLQLGIGWFNDTEGLNGARGKGVWETTHGHGAAADANVFVRGGRRPGHVMAFPSCAACCCATL